MSHNLDPATLERIVGAAVAAVLAELGGGATPARPAGRRVAVVVGTTPIGLDFAVASLQAMGDVGLDLDWLASGRGVELTNQRLGAEIVRDVSTVGCPLEMAKSVEAVIIAALDRPLALRIAATNPEEFRGNLVLEALCLGKPVIAATDGLRLDRPEATPQLRAALAAPIGALEAYGATCCAAVDLGPTVAATLASPAWVAHHENRPLITAEQVEAAGGELLLPADAILTPLAADRARELGVRLRRLPG